MRKGGQLLAYVHRNHCFAFYIHILVILAFISGYIAFLSSFLTQDRSQARLHFVFIYFISSTDTIPLCLVCALAEFDGPLWRHRVKWQCGLCFGISHRWAIPKISIACAQSPPS